MSSDPKHPRPKIGKSLLENLQDGNTVDVLIVFKTRERKNTEVDPGEDIDREEMSEKYMAEAVQILEKENGRLPFSWEALYEINMIFVSGAYLKLIESIAAIDNVAYIEEDEIRQVPECKPKFWSRFKSYWR
ncbi:hypothetical protein Bhyg_06251 [Pseudolycoriella hygida]|uniref:Uncharacterized protein n=1 Tax=Pseudolycoriella hygida TaxID=35572 RepID=A0A9Q0N0E2_9DIPT|nr:hypothetical protein Bhyg_06251 [Pseudolycoriella hygida]